MRREDLGRRSTASTPGGARNFAPSEARDVADAPGRYRDDEDPRLEPQASLLIDASKDEKIEALQEQVQRMHKSLAEVVNRFKDAEERGRKATPAHGAEIKNRETPIVQVMDEHADCVNAEDAIEGLHRMLQSALEDKWSSEEKRARGKTAEGFRGGIAPTGRE